MSFLLHGFLDLPVWGYFVVAGVSIHLTIMAVTLYLHRDQTHRGLDLHPAVRHVCRFWLWLTTGMVTKQWVAVHRKHHAHCETEADPHSPKIKGLRRVLLEGAELYRIEAANPETVEKYGRGTPEDWLERHLYTPRNVWGVSFLLVIDLALFGVLGLTLWAVQMLAIPVLAAGVVNGLGHFSGYRNFECKDASTNVLPWGLVVGGEELHNNHHAFPSSARFSQQPWEIDLGWWYIRLLAKFGLARIRRVAPRLLIDEAQDVNLQTVRAVVVSRMHVLRHYSREVIAPVVAQERRGSRGLSQRLLAGARRLLTREPSLLSVRQRRRLALALARNRVLNTVYEFRMKLEKLWESTTPSNESLLLQFKQWCREAEASRIEALHRFAARLKGYALQPT